MQTSDFSFALPAELIAQQPATPRDAARLLCMGRRTGAVRHHVFHDLPQLLRRGDLLVTNNSKVLPARLIGRKQESGGVCELLLLRQTRGDDWECLARPGKRLRPGMRLEFGDGSLQAEILETLPGGGKLARFVYGGGASLYEKLDKFGKMPLPPYIKRQLKNNGDYQTVYAKTPGSAAAPTAGLHFTPGLMDALQATGVGFAEITLHVGLGTFRPVQQAHIENHEMHSEWYSISEAAAESIRRAKEGGGRVIAVGTTSCRTLETAGKRYGEVRAGSGETGIFIYPGYVFSVIDGLITNFHLPESTLIMLVSAFCGRERTLNAYAEAVRERYRFFSFGDAMLIV